MPAEATVSVYTRRIPFTRFTDFPPLFRDYCEQFDRLADFFAGDFRLLDERRSAVDRALSVERDRATIADVLLEQNEIWGLDEMTRRNIEALRSTDTAAVVTGQQVGLLGGPIFTVLKAITTLQMAEQLTEETGHTVVPIFWLGVEDHDFAEITATRLLRRNEPFELRYSDAPEGNPGPVGRIRMSEEIDRIVDEIDEILPDTDFKPEVMRAVRETYRSGETFGDAFAKLLKQLLSESGLILISSDDPRLKGLAKDLFRSEISDPETLTLSVRRWSAKLAERYHQQVQVTPSNLFLFEDGGRYPLDVDESGFRLRGLDKVYSQKELLELVDRRPERFSPNVVMRPVMQDILLPTAMYVGGPGEISYLAQYKPAYEWAGLPMPLMYPRVSVTLVESKVEKVLEKYDLEVADFGEDLERLFQRVVVDAMSVDLDELFQDASRHLHESINRVKPGLEEVDQTLTKAAEAARKALMDEFEKLKAKAVRLEKKNQDVVRTQLEKARVNLYPDGKLQERTLSILYFLNKYSPGLIGDLRTSLSTDTAAHQVVLL